VLAGVDDNISWFELVLASNVDGASVTKFYIDNIQLSYEAPPPSPEKSTDVVIGNWEQDMDGWVAGAGADVLFNDHNGVTLGDYSLDVFLQDGSGWQDSVLTLDVLDPNLVGLLDAFKANSEISMDITRLVADWPEDVMPQWNEIVLVIQAGGDGWTADWVQLPVRASWSQNDGDQTVKATWDYGERMAEMNYLEGVTWMTLRIVSNVNSDYEGWSLFYLDNMRLTGAGGAVDPQPADGTGNVPTDTMLGWTAGAFAASHHLYLGTNRIKVSDADMDSDPEVLFAILDTNSFDPNGLEFNTQYFWRVDEVNDANPDSPWTSPVWSFTTANFVGVDDFEAYNDVNPGEPDSNRIFDTWTDGYGDDTNGALIGHDFPPYAEQTTVRSGLQSMPFYYDNTGAALQSETQRIWVEPQDWTASGFNALNLSTHGSPQDAPGELYVIIEDSAGASHKVANPDSEIFTAEQWKEWSVSLDDVAAAGVNVAAVTKLVIGIADLAGQAEANGLLYIDDIQVGHPNQDGVNQLVNGGFEDGVMDPWGIWGDAGAEVVQQLVGAAVPEAPIEGGSCLHVTVNSPGGNPWDYGFNHGGHVFKAGKKYTLSVFLKCKQGALDVTLNQELGEDPWDKYAVDTVTMTDTWAEYSITTPVFAAPVEPGSITFHIAFAAAEFWVDGARWYEGDYVAPDSGN
jgi:hypothetical protein